MNVRSSNNNPTPRQYLYLTNKIQRENNAIINNQVDLGQGPSSSCGIVQFGTDKLVKNSSSMVALSKFKNQTRHAQPVSFNFPPRSAVGQKSNQIGDSQRQINLVAVSSTSAAGMSNL